MKEYYIRAFFSDWHKVSKEAYEDFKKSILVGAININKNDKEQVENFLSRHAKAVEVNE